MAGSASLQLFNIGRCLNVFQKFANSSTSKIPVRYLRGSRNRNGNNPEKQRLRKLQSLMRALADNIKQDIESADENSAEKVIQKNAIKQDIESADENSTEKALQKNANENDVPVSNEQQTTTLITEEDLIKKLEEKLTPLEGMRYTRQLEKKHLYSLRILKTLGEKLLELKIPISMGFNKLPCPVELTLPSLDLERYRNKDEYSIGVGLDGVEKTVGFFLDPPSEYSSTLCIKPGILSVVKDSHKEFAKKFQEYIRQSPLPACQHFSDGGYWKNLIVRSNVDDDIMGIVVMHPQNLSKGDIDVEKAKLKDYFSSVSSSHFNLQSLYFQTCAHSRCSHEQSPFELIMGNPTIIEQSNNMKFHISPDSFFHINTKAAEGMHSTLLKMCRVKKNTTILDLCCGIGPLSLTFSNRVKKCIGVDDSLQAIGDAKLNAKENNVHNAEFIHGEPEVLIKNILENDYHEDLLAILNASRSGISKHMIPALREHKSMKKIIYIATKPHAALENFVMLCRPPGRVRHLGQPFLPILAMPVDLWPQTDQFALVVMFQRLQ